MKSWRSRIPKPVLRCPVRGCATALSREERRFVCECGHSFDIARSGYVNLLQPQERRSKQPGDTVEAIAARRRLHDRGLTAPLLDAIATIASPGAEDCVLDAGCGEGFYLGSLAQRFGLDAHGIDISAPAIQLAAQRYPDYEWVVGNADRSLPYLDRSFSLILSITARRNAAEFRRAMRESGRLLVAVPASNDLIELRGTGRERVSSTVAELAPEFQLTHHQRVTATAELEEAGIADVLHSIYRPMTSQAAKAMPVTFSLDILTFR